MRVKRTGVTIPNDVLQRLDNLIAKLGMKSRSKAITEAILNYITEREVLLSAKGEIIAIISFVYIHSRGDTLKRLTHIQHHFIDEILFNTHIHLSEDRCLEIVVARGQADKIRSLVREIDNIQGVELVRCINVKV